MAAPTSSTNADKKRWDEVLNMAGHVSLEVVYGKMIEMPGQKFRL